MSIASGFSRCLGAYQELVAALAEATPPLRVEISLSELEDELGRLKVWAGNIAAHKTGRSSLDFRLRDASPLRDRIIGLLQDMETMLREAIPIVIGDRTAQDEAASDSDSSDDDLSGDQGSSMRQAGPRPTELQQTLLDIVDIVDCLYKLSITIRNPSPHDRLVKAASVNTSFYEQWDINHVKNKFPAATEYSALKLGKAISRRRQYLKYREKHRQKLAQDIVSPPKRSFGQRDLNTETSIPAIAVLSEEPDEHTSPFLTRNEGAPSIVATTILTQTTASEFFGGNVDIEGESDSGQTQTSYATSVGDEGRLSIPPLPKESQGGKPFECPYCFTIISVKNSHSWKKHLFRDLQPYVCTFDGCSKDCKMFESRHEWFDHELQAHRKEWYCSAGCECSFALQPAFEAHMMETHVGTFSAHQLIALVDMCQRPVEENSETACPLCNETMQSMRQLCRHLARHLEALALFALPRNKDEDKEDPAFGSDKVQVSDASRGLSDGSLSFSSKSQSVSEDAEFDYEVDTDGDISKLLNDFPESEKLPQSFMKPFQYGFRNLTEASLDTGQQPILLQIFKDAREVILGPDFQHVMNSESNVKDIISLFYLEASASCEKHQTKGDDIWIESLDEAAAYFVNLMAATITKTPDSAETTELVVRLEGLRDRLLARVSRNQKLRKTKSSEDPRQTKEDDRLMNSDWFKCWGITEADQKNFPDREIALQQNIHAIWTSERTYLEGLDTLITLYQDDLIDNPSIAEEDGERFKFIEQLFTRADVVKRVHEPLLGSLKARLLQQGPFVQSISGIFRVWLQEHVKEAYFEYAREFPSSELLIQREMKKNPQFRRVFEGDSAQIDWLKYLRSPMSRIQQTIRLLGAVHGTALPVDTDDLSQLQLDIDEVKSFYSIFEFHVRRGVEKSSRLELAGKLVLRPEMGKVELNLEDERRQLFYKGDVVQLSAIGGNFLISLACLFDNYFILGTPVQRETGKNPMVSEIYYDVKRLPIPMSLLLLEDSALKPIPVPESATSKGLDSPLLYPFTVKHLGKSETYMLYTTSAQSRDTWCEQIITALQTHVANEELNSKAPFSLSVLVDLASQPRLYERTNKHVRIKGSALDKAIENGDRTFRPQPLRPRAQVCAEVTCATTFSLSGLHLTAVGTVEGFSVCKANESRGCTHFIKLSNVTQMFFLEDFNNFVVLASNTLWAYQADPVWDYFSGVIDLPSSSVPQKVPPKTEIAKDVKFFAAWWMKDRTLFVLGKRKGLHTTFNVLEPVYPRPAKKSIFSLRDLRTRTEVFREFDEFYLPTQCFGINMFKSYFAISTSKGFELMTLDKKVPMTVPDLKEPNLASIATRLQVQKPLGMFRLPDEEFFCCYEETGVYLNKHGEISRSVVMEFIGKARKAAVEDRYLILFSKHFVEIRDVLNGSLRQVIAGQNIRCLDDAQGGVAKRHVVMSMAHPDLEDRQLVLELHLDAAESNA